MTKIINVLDKGYVNLRAVTGNDDTVVDAARVSYDKSADNYTAEKNARLINYLAKHGHTSPFRHAFLTFEVKAPLLVARQWWKHVAGSDHTMDAWNESSRRYITEQTEFHIPEPDMWRSKPENSKQGSGEPVSYAVGERYWTQLNKHITDGEALYESAMQEGIAPEQARLFLPAYAMYVRWTWSASLQSVAHFLNLRLESDAQKEIQEYAQAVYELSAPHFPISLEALKQVD